MRLLPYGPCDASAISPDGKTIATGRSGGPQAHPSRSRSSCGIERPASVSMSLRLKVILPPWLGRPTAGFWPWREYSSAEIWDRATRNLVRKLDGPAEMHCLSLCWSKDGNWIIGSTFNPYTVNVWKASSGKLVHRWDCPEVLHGIAVSNDSKWLATAGKHAPRIYDTTDFQRQAERRKSLSL